MIITTAEMQVVLGLTASITDAERALIELVIPAAQAAVADVLMYDPEQLRRTEILPQIGDMPALTESDEWRSTATHAYQYVRSAATNVLQLRFLPLRTMHGCYEDTQARHGAYDGAFGADTALVEGTDYMPEYDVLDADGLKICTGGLLRRVGGCWPSEPGTVKVTYTAGYSAAELNGTAGGAVNARAIKDALLETALLAFHQYKRLQKGTTGFAGGVKQSESLGDYSYTLAPLTGALAPLGVHVPPSARARLQAFINYGVCFQ